MRRSPWVCFALISLLLVGLMLSPKTGWLVRQQAKAAFGGQGEALVKSLDGPKTPSVLNETGELARTLRELCRETLVLERPADEQLVSLYSRVSPPRDTSKALSFYEVQALTDQGEALDPGNAFFPALRAVALLAFHSDEQALVALHQAAQCPRFHDYLQDEIRTRLAQLDQVQGRHTALADIQAEQSLTAPHLSRLRALARVATALAVKKELAGDLVGGLAIRRDVRALGERLRDQPGWAVTQSVGISLTTIATARPGGEPLRTYTGSSQETLKARRRDTLAAHAKYWGKAEDNALEQLFARNDAVESLFTTSTYPRDSFFELAEQWQRELYLLASVLATLLVGAIFALLAKLQGKIPVRPGVRLALWYGLGIVPVALWRSGLGEGEVWLHLALTMALWLIGLFALGQAWRSTKPGKRGKELGLAMATLLVLGQVVLLAVLAMWGVQETLDPFYDTYLRCFAGREGDPIPWWESLWSAASYRAFFAAPTLAPLLSLAPILAIISRVKRVPVVFGVLRGLGRCALPVALILTVLYAWQVQQTAHLEAQLRTELKNSLSQ